MLRFMLFRGRFFHIFQIHFIIDIFDIIQIFYIIHQHVIEYGGVITLICTKNIVL